MRRYFKSVIQSLYLIKKKTTTQTLGTESWHYAKIKTVITKMENLMKLQIRLSIIFGFMNVERDATTD